MDQVSQLTPEVITDEPVAAATLVGALFTMLVAVATGFFGWDPTEGQIAAIASVQTFTILVLGFVARNMATANTHVALTKKDVELLESS